MPNRSVIAKAERISPFSSGVSHSFCCWGDPYRARTSEGRQLAFTEGAERCTHVTRVWSSTIDCLRCNMSPPSKYLCHNSVLLSVSTIDQELMSQ